MPMITPAQLKTIADCIEALETVLESVSGTDESEDAKAPKKVRHAATGGY